MTDHGGLRHCYHLPERVNLPEGMPAEDQRRLHATILAAITRAVRIASPDDHPALAQETRPAARARLAGPLSGNLVTLASYGADPTVTLPVTPKVAPVAGQSGNTPSPTPMPTTDVPYPPDRPDHALTEPDTPNLIAYLRAEMSRGPGLAAQGPLLLVDRSVPFWGFEDVRRYAEVLARGWQARLAGQKAVDIAQTLRKLAKDFDETMQGSFARHRTFKVPLDELDKKITKLLAFERIRLEKEAARRHLAGKDLDSAVLEGLLGYRVRLEGQIEAHVVETAWGWMRERREHLDFGTLKTPGVRWLDRYRPPLPPSVIESDVVHEELMRRNRELSQKEQDTALERATKALRKSQHDPSLELTDEQEATAIAKAEAQKLGGQEEVDKAVTAAAAAVEHDDFVDIKEVKDGVRVWGTSWDPQSEGVLPKTAEFVLVLSRTYGKRFTASNYLHHGSWGFKDRGRSIDLLLDEREPSGFYPPAEAIRFALAIDDAARQLGLEWRVLYDDASVVRAVNNRLGIARMGETAGVFRGEKNEVVDINWHGPLVTHFHLDLVY